MGKSYDEAGEGSRGSEGVGSPWAGGLGGQRGRILGGFRTWLGWVSAERLEVAGLVTLAALPLVDGFFMLFLAMGMWKDVWSDLAFGLSAFSGAGCVVAAMRLKGSLVLRVGQVAATYGLVALGAVVLAMAQLIFRPILPPNLHLFTALFLLGLGLWISEVPVVQRVAEWTGFQAAVKVMLAASLTRGILAARLGERTAWSEGASSGRPAR